MKRLVPYPGDVAGAVLPYVAPLVVLLIAVGQGVRAAVRRLRLSGSLRTVSAAELLQIPVPAMPIATRWSVGGRPAHAGWGKRRALVLSDRAAPSGAGLPARSGARAADGPGRISVEPTATWTQRVRRPMEAMRSARPSRRLRSPWREGMFVLAVAVGLRLITLAIAGRTFDPDEFVVIMLGQAVGHGSVPYTSFTFYHPPGMLYLVAALEPLVRWWWESARVAVVACDVLSCLLVWHIARTLYAERTAVFAGLLYAVSPLALVTAVRVEPDPVITVLGLVGLALLLRGGRGHAVMAGACLALAVWCKYPGLLFLPVYLAAAPRRSGWLLGAFGVAVTALFVPFLTHASRFYADTVLWQMGGRGTSDLAHHLGGVGGYWLGLNVLSAVALWQRRGPAWARLGFGSGLVFLLSAQAYYHYFVPVLPFAALLAAPILEQVVRSRIRVAALGCVALAIFWALDLDIGIPLTRLYVSAPDLVEAQTTALVIDRSTPRSAPILTDQMQYALLAHRSDIGNYFWNMRGMYTARDLERLLPRVAAVVQTRGGESGYPAGFIDYLEDRHVPHVRTRQATVWVLRSAHASGT